jgi:hypothetical protein
MRLSHRRAAFGLLLLALVGLAYLPIFMGGVLYQRDVTRHTVPEAAFLARSLQHGDSPWWNPRIGLGVPTLSNPLNEVFYPPNLLQVALPSPRATSFFLFAHLVLGALGMMALVRRLTRPDGPADEHSDEHSGDTPGLIAGLAWALSGYCTSEVTAGLRAVAGAYLPWCALGLLHLACAIRDGKNLRAFLGATAAAAIPFALCFLTGEVFFPIFACAFAMVVVVGHALDGARTPARFAFPGWAWRPMLRLALGLTLALLLAAGSAAVVLVPVKQAAETTARRAPLSRSEAEVGSLHPWRLAEMVAPGAFGDPYAAYPAGAWVGEPALGQRPLLYGAYVGSSVLALAALALGRRRRLTATLAVAAMLALLAAMGRHTGVHAVVRFLIPPLGYMRGPEKYLAILQACVAVLAGLGAARVGKNGPGERTPWHRGLYVVASLVGLAAAAPLFPSVLAPQLRTSALIGAVLAALVSLLVWLAPRRVHSSHALLVALVAVDLSSAVFSQQNYGPSALLDAEPPAATAVLTDARARGEIAPPRIYRSEKVDDAIERARPPRSSVEVGRNLIHTLIDNHAGVFDVATIPGYDAALPEALTRLWLAGRTRGADLLRLTGTAYAIIPASATADPHLRRLLEPAPGAELVFVEGTLPRAYVAQSADVLPDSEARRAVFAPDVVSGGRVILASPAPAPSPAGPTEASGRACRLIAYANTRIEATCTALTASLAVFVEQFADGWSATVDGQPATILRANLVMRAVPLPPGEHRIVLAFSPPGLGRALAVSVTAALLLAFLLVWAKLGTRAATRD